MRADHKKLTAALIAHDAQQVARLKAAVRTRDQSIAELKKERDVLVQSIATSFTDAPSIALENRIRDAVVIDIEKRASGSYYSRDRAMAAVGQVADLHHATPSGKCHCGKMLNSCRDFRAIEFIADDLDRWERRQIERMRAGKPHGLPRNHPEARKHPSSRDWLSWRGQLSTVPESRRGMSA